jgi:hypothetical protein
MKENRLVIIIPIYNKVPLDTEKASLVQFSKVYHWTWDVVLICPDDFTKEDIDLYIKLLNPYSSYDITYRHYSRDYFKSPSTYSQLLKLNSFYLEFYNYEYMLIFQTDCWALNFDKLRVWMDEDFDYVGAPILTNKIRWLSAPCCGNGGLSLRKISSFVKYTSDKRLIDELNKNEDYYNYEDIFFCQGISQHMYIDMPSWEDCSMFAWDMNPDILWEKNQKILPDIGIHAWTKNKLFWRNKIGIPE